MTYNTREWMPGRVIRRASPEEDHPVERRRFARTKIALPGRYLTQEGEECECVTVDISPGGVRFQTSAPYLPAPGSLVTAYVRDLGRLHGPVVRRLKDGFALTISCTETKTERLAQKLAALGQEGTPDRRLFPRVAVAGALIPVSCADGRNEIAGIIDVSTGGIAFRTGLALTPGDVLRIGDQTGIVARVFEGGAAARFL